MILTDYFRSNKDITWDYAKQCGVNHGVIRLPETESFDLTNAAHWQNVYDNFVNYGITPLIVEPMPNCVHDHIKSGDAKRDESIEQVIKMLPIMRTLNIETICFNWMAHIGWLRTASNIVERGGALVTGFGPITSIFWMQLFLKRKSMILSLPCIRMIPLCRSWVMYLEL